MHLNWQRTLLACALWQIACLPASGATYKTGFMWMWEKDFSVFDNTPNDAGSINATSNTLLSEGAPTEDVWAYVDLRNTREAFPEAVREPKLLSRFTTYFENQGSAWEPDRTTVPSIGRDTGPRFHFIEDRYRPFLKPASANPDRPTVAVRWTAPITAVYQIHAGFAMPPSPKPDAVKSDGVKAYVARNNQKLAGPVMIQRLQSKDAYVESLNLRKGERLYFALSAVNTGNSDETILDLAITLTGFLNDADTAESP